MNSNTNRFLKISLLNLLIVATLGVILRYKILFSLPFVDQKNLLHAHSHFAFAGWITQTLMVLMVAYLSKQTNNDEFKKYNKLLIANLVTAYGMLVSFPFQGYGFVSITFSTLSVFTFYFFSYNYWKSLNQISTKSIAHTWFKIGLLLGVLSSFGTFALAFMMATKTIEQNRYLSSIYFYLHFQYNGWFFFASMGLLHTLLPKNILNVKEIRTACYLFAFASIPSYILSILWLDVPLYLYALGIVASIVQVIAWLILLSFFVNNWNIIFNKFDVISKWLLRFSAFAVSIKLALQVGSTIPFLNQFAFGFRAIIIAYLHLVLLGIFSLFLLGFMFAEHGMKLSKTTKYGLVVFTIGVILNELVLMLQGVASFSYNVFPFANLILFGMALVLFSGILIILLSQNKKQLD